MSLLTPESNRSPQLTDSLGPDDLIHQAVVHKIIMSDVSARQRNLELDREGIIQKFLRYASDQGVGGDLQSDDDSHVAEVAKLASKVISDWNNSYSLRSGAALVLDQLRLSHKYDIDPCIQETYSNAWHGQTCGLISFLNGAPSATRDRVCEMLCSELPAMVGSPMAIAFYKIVSCIEAPEIAVQLAAEFVKTEAGAEFLFTSIENQSINQRSLEIAVSNLIFEEGPQFVSRVAQWCARECGKDSKTASDIWNYYIPASEHRFAAIELISVACESLDNQQRVGALMLLKYLPEAAGGEDLLLQSLYHTWSRAVDEEKIRRVLDLTKELTELDPSSQTAAEIRSKLTDYDLSIELRSQIGLVSAEALSKDINQDDRTIAIISYQLGNLLNEIAACHSVSPDVFTDAARIAEIIPIHGEEHEVFLRFVLDRAANELKYNTSGQLRYSNSSGRIVADAVECIKKCFRRGHHRGVTFKLSEDIASEWLDIVFSDPNVEGWELVEGVEIYEAVALKPNPSVVKEQLNSKFFSGFHITGFQDLVHLMHERNLLTEEHVRYWFEQSKVEGNSEWQAMKIGPYLCSLRHFLSDPQNSYLDTKAALAEIEVRSPELVDDDWLPEVIPPVDVGEIRVSPVNWKDALIPIIEGRWKGRPIRPNSSDDS